MKKLWKSLVIMVFGLLLAAPVAAQPTEVTVRVRTKGAKFMGTSMGGALILIKDADSGELLAKGLVAGGTGATDLIMKNASKTGQRLADAKTASFTASLDIDEPRYLEISAYGPLAQRQAANRVSLTQWLVPGKPLTGGDAMVLEMPGLIVDVQAPPTHIKLSGLPQTVAIAANVTMMCGCPIGPDQIWPDSAFEVRAIIKKDGRNYSEIPLAYAGQTSQFGADLKLTEAGSYEGIVYAYEAGSGNTGLDRFTLVVK
ncbi:MAG: hypothetical protein JXR89_03050 [Deltaproteobacteria bacterium]|nr:hypothetical protein [Deltaproteobacteria bacterium]